MFGFDSSVINGAVNAIEGQFELDPSVTGFVVAVALLGCALGAWAGGRLADRWGRTHVMVLGAILFFVSSILSAIAFTAWDLAVWRFMAGVGIGIASVIAPAYIAEIAPAAMRGRLGSLQQLAITVGIFAALLSDQILAESADGAANVLWLGWEAWRWMFLVAVVPAAVYGILALRIPESPRYLAAQGATTRPAPCWRACSARTRTPTTASPRSAAASPRTRRTPRRAPCVAARSASSPSSG
nr:hypothetical protein GCM10025730_28700 [Promicromonospora thailandica]